MTATETTATTTAASITAVAKADTLTAAPVSAACCPNCGFSLDQSSFEETQTALLNAQKQIADLEAQVRLLNQKATAAVDRWADYEDELAKLRAQLESRPQTPTPSPLQQQSTTAKQQHPASLPTPPSSAAGLPTPSPSRASFLTTSAASRITALLSRKSPPAVPPTLKPLPSALSPIPSAPSSASYSTTTTTPGGTSTTPTTANPPPTTTTSNNDGRPLSPPRSLAGSAQLTAEDLLAALAREQTLRQEAEGRLSATSREVEELSASLFEQANEMVAAERRARARLEARVGELERRERDKRRRLERLERAVGRIERVRGVLAAEG
jgi:hypothetical protein